MLKPTDAAARDVIVSLVSLNTASPGTRSFRARSTREGLVGSGMAKLDAARAQASLQILTLPCCRVRLPRKRQSCVRDSVGPKAQLPMRA